MKIKRNSLLLGVPVGGESPKDRNGGRWGVLVACTLALLSLVPQFDLWMRRGSEWKGAYAYAHYDEDIYAAYLNGLVLGRPRRSDPLVDDGATTVPSEGTLQTPESLFSVQFVTPYFLAALARLLGLSTSQIYIAYPPLLAILTTLALYFLLGVLTKDWPASAVGALVVLCFGALAGRDGKLIHLLDGQVWYAGFPFLRRYQPGLGLALFFVFVLLIWLTAVKAHRAGLVAAAGAGIVFGLLVFSYLFVWTAALAWFGIFVALWLALGPGEKGDFLRRLVVAMVPAVAALGLYWWLISRIASNTATVQALEKSRVPDFLRGPEVIGIILLLAIFLIIKRRRASLRDPLLILVASFGLLPLVVFNQQVVTGYSLQPFHYEIFIANYAVLAGVVLLFAIHRTRPTATRALWGLFLVTVAWGLTEIRYSTIRELERNLARDGFVPVAKRLNELSSPSIGRRPIVFSPDTYVVADSIGGYTSVAPLWATHLVLTPSLTHEARENRFFQYLGFSGVSAAELEEKLRSKSFVETCALFGYERSTRHLTRDYMPLSEDEIAEKRESYSRFLEKLDRQVVKQTPLEFVVIPEGLQFDYAPIDRWYERDRREDLGEYLLYRVKLREE